MVTHSSILPGESYGQRNLVDLNPQGGKELDMIEETAQHTSDTLTHGYRATEC